LILLPGSMYPAQLGEDTVDVKSASGGWTAVCPYSRSRPRFRDGARIWRLASRSATW